MTFSADLTFHLPLRLDEPELQAKLVLHFDF